MTITLESERALLIACSLEIIEDLLTNHYSLQKRIGAKIVESWVYDKEIYELYLAMLQNDPSCTGWLNWLIIDKSSNIIIGEAGFKGKPGIEGVVEIAYQIIPEFRNRGYASEAVKELITWAFDFSSVKTIIAETDSSNLHSIRLLNRMNMHCFDSIVNQDVEILRWEVKREDFFL